LTDLRAFRSAILKLVLVPENNPWVASDSAESKSGDWTRAASWVLSQDLYSFPTDYRAVEALQDRQGIEPKVFVNDTRWHGFVEWSTFLGIAWNSKARAGTIFEPGDAVEAVLPEVLQDAKELPVSAFLLRLGLLLPVIDG